MANTDGQILFNNLNSNKQNNSVDAEQFIPQSLSIIRNHLDMDVAFVSQFLKGRRYFRYVDSKVSDCPVKLNAYDPLEESYCQRVVDGRLPELMQDAAQVPEALKLPVTRALPVGAHMSVPVVLEDGSIYGTYCCFSYHPNKSLQQRDLNVMRAFAEIVANHLSLKVAAEKAQEEIRGRIQEILGNGSLTTVYQPIYRVSDLELTGFESLSRFQIEPYRPPDVWFKEADYVGMGIQLQQKAIASALRGFALMPDHLMINVNISPEVLINGDTNSLFDGYPLNRVVLEITEHDAIDYYDEIHKKLDVLRDKGMQLAVDDAGAGYSSFKHILNLRPEFIKLDRSLISGINDDINRQALVKAFIYYGDKTGCKIVAEGVETREEFMTLKELEIDKAQGYLLGKPAGITSSHDMDQFRHPKVFH